MLKELITDKLLFLEASVEKLDETNPIPVDYAYQRDILDAKISVLEEILKEERLSRWVDKINDVTHDLMKSMKEELIQEEIGEVIEAIDGFTKGYRYIIKSKPETDEFTKTFDYREIPESEVIMK